MYTFCLCVKYYCESCAHLERNVPEWLTMKYWHIQYRKRTCCCLDRRIQFQGRIVSYETITGIQWLPVIFLRNNHWQWLLCQWLFLRNNHWHTVTGIQWLPGAVQHSLRLSLAPPIVRSVSMHTLGKQVATCEAGLTVIGPGCRLCL